jgi:UDP-N-acetylmuramate dehydrogenase
MIRIEENFPLKSLNTFGMDVKARRFAMISTSGELNDLIISGILTEMPLLILGGGSNILFTSDFEDWY